MGATQSDIGDVLDALSRPRSFMLEFAFGRVAAPLQRVNHGFENGCYVDAIHCHCVPLYIS